MGPTWVPPGSCRPQMGPMLAPWTMLSELLELLLLILAMYHLYLVVDRYGKHYVMINAFLLFILYFKPFLYTNMKLMEMKICDSCHDYYCQAHNIISVKVETNFARGCHLKQILFICNCLLKKSVNLFHWRKMGIVWQYRILFFELLDIPQKERHNWNKFMWNAAVCLGWKLALPQSIQWMAVTEHTHFLIISRILHKRHCILKFGVWKAVFCKDSLESMVHCPIIYSRFNRSQVHNMEIIVWWSLPWYVYYISGHTWFVLCCIFCGDLLKDITNFLSSLWMLHSQSASVKERGYW